MDAPERLSPAAAIEVAVEAERRGFDSAWVGDHVQWGTAVLEPLCTLAAVAARTERIRLGTGVLLLPLRHPMLVAQGLATLDQLSGGRLLAGFGVGTTTGGDFTAVGVDPTRRGARMDRSVRVLRALFRGDTVDERGEDVVLEDARLSPLPIQASVPFFFGGGSRAALRRVAELGDGWIAAFTDPDRLARQVGVLREACEARGRDSAELQVLALMYAEVGASVEEAERRAEGYLRRQYGASAERLRPSSAFGPPDLLRERADAFLRAGATGLIFGSVSDRYREMLDTVGEVLALPAPDPTP